MIKKELQLKIKKTIDVLGPLPLSIYISGIFLIIFGFVKILMSESGSLQSQLGGMWFILGVGVALIAIGMWYARWSGRR